MVASKITYNKPDNPHDVRPILDLTTASCQRPLHPEPSADLVESDADEEDTDDGVEIVL